MEIKDLQGNLPRLWRKTIHEITGYTITYIGYVVSGKRPVNTQAAKEIMEVAYALYEKNKREKKAFREKLKSLQDD